MSVTIFKIFLQFDELLIHTMTHHKNHHISQKKVNLPEHVVFLITITDKGMALVFTFFFLFVCLFLDTDIVMQTLITEMLVHILIVEKSSVFFSVSIFIKVDRAV